MTRAVHTIMNAVSPLSIILLSTPSLQPPKQEVHFPPEAPHTASHGCIFGVIERSCIPPFIKLTKDLRKTPTATGAADKKRIIRRNSRREKTNHGKKAREHRRTSATGKPSPKRDNRKKAPGKSEKHVRKRQLKEKRCRKKKFMWICRRSRQHKHRRGR